MKTGNWNFRYRFKLAIVAGAFVLALAAPAVKADDSKAAGTGRQAVIAVKGLACPFCVYGLEKHLRKLPGAKQVHADLGKGEAVVEFATGSKVTDEQIQKAVRDAGFTPGRIEWRSPQKGEKPEASPRKMATSHFAIEGMRCQYCVTNISMVLEKMPGVESAKVDLPGRTATVIYDAEKTNPSEIARAIEQAGKFHAILKGEAKTRAAEK